MNIDDALPISSPDVSVEEVAVLEKPSVASAVVVKDELHSGSSSNLSSTVRNANVSADNLEINLTTSACDVSGESVGFQCDVALSPHVSEPSHTKDCTSRESPTRCAISPIKAPHLPHEDADYQQRICGTPELRNHLLLTHHSASDSQLLSDANKNKESTNSKNPSSELIDCMFGTKKSALLGSEARRSANRCRLLDRSETGVGALGTRTLSSRRVSFPDNDSELVTGYLEPANPWATGELFYIYVFSYYYFTYYPNILVWDLSKKCEILPGYAPNACRLSVVVVRVSLAAS